MILWINSISTYVIEPTLSIHVDRINLFSILSQLVSVLREVRYLESLKREDIEIPGSAAGIYSKNDLFRQYLANLDLIVSRLKSCAI